MHAKTYVEILTPKQSDLDLEAGLERFAERYNAVVDCGCTVSVPDNPMGVLHFQLTEVLSELSLRIVPEQLLMHLNTFHTKEHLDQTLRTAAECGIRQLLVVSGDGGERLPKLNPASLSFEGNAVTSVELLRYIRREYPEQFVCGVAFNQYEPEEHEGMKLKRKLDQGASFVITQPVVVGCDRLVRAIRDCGVPLAVGAWMSKNIKLLSDCIGYPVVPGGDYDPFANLKTVLSVYADCGVYLALVGFKTQLPAIRELLLATRG